jgi:uncharacterized protein (DUF2164 family)
MDMAGQCQPLGRHDLRQRLKVFKTDVPLSVLDRQLAARGATQGIHEAAAHMVDRVSDMHSQLPAL